MKPYEKAILKDKTKIGFNDYYTTYEQADAVLGSLKDLGFLDNIKAICCPCDSKDSNIVKWLQNNTNARIDYFNYLDCNSPKARQKMMQCGCVITNPPFSANVFRPLLEFLRNNKIPYLLWGPMPSNRGCIDKFDYFFSPSRPVDVYYNTPSGDKARISNVYYYTNFDVPYPDYNYEPCDTKYFKGIPFYDHVRNVPPDYYGWFFAPVNIVGYVKNYDIDVKRSKCADHGRYIRLCIRRKEDGTVTKITTGTSIRASRRS